MSEALSTLLEQAEGQRNVALAAFNQARSRRDDARVQAQDLETYRDEYAQRWKREFQQRGAPLEVMRSYHQFSQRLDQAIAQQAQAVDTLEQALARANDVLAAHELRVASVRKLIERRLLEQRASAERREQRLADDLRMRTLRNPFAGTQL